MKPELQRSEIEFVISDDDDLSIENAPLGQSGPQRVDEFGKIPVQRLLITALNQDLIAVTKDECAKSIPLWLEDPIVSGWEFLHALRKHG